MIDLRSDTVTLPTDSMRQAMTKAAVGDDVLDGDPTADELQARVAELVGTQAAVWMPSGSMSNLTALTLNVGRGERYMAPRNAHVVSHELGTGAWFAGGMPVELPWSVKPGVPSPDDVTAEATGKGAYYDLETTLLCLENTHNHAGGTIIPPDTWPRLVDAAHSHGMRVHLDGARIWHAAAALGRPVKDLTAGADTISVCLSKGLGAPMGAVLCLPKNRVEQAKRIRKMLGGGVRQVGIEAAAGLVALDENLPRIDEDRVNAITLSEGLRALGFTVTTPETNIFLVDVDDAPTTIKKWAQAGVLTSQMGHAVRFVTHLGIGPAQVAETLRLIAVA